MTGLELGREAPDFTLRRLDAAFFLVNGIISVTFFGFVLVDAIVS